IVRDEPGDERDFLQYVILVRAGQLGHMDVGVVDPDSEALPEKALDDVDNRALAEVVGARLKRKAQETNVLLPQSLDLIADALLLLLVALRNALQQRAVEVMVMRDGAQRLEILWQAGSAVGETGFKIRFGHIQLRIHAENSHYLARVDLQLLADVPDLVGERDLQCMKTVANVLHDFRNARRRGYEFDTNRSVYLSHPFRAPCEVGTHQSEWRILEILDRRAFTHKLRIRDNGKILPVFPYATSSISFATRSPVPGKTVDRRATTCLSFFPTRALAISPATLKTASRSRCPVGVEGVPTQMKEIVVPWIASATLFIAEILPAWCCSAISSSMPFSMIVALPWFMKSTF